MAEQSIPNRCACGCGTPINRNLRWAAQMRGAGVPERVIERETRQWSNDDVAVRTHAYGHTNTVPRYAPSRAQYSRVAEAPTTRAFHYITVSDRGAGRDTAKLRVTSVRGAVIRRCVYCAIGDHRKRMATCPCCATH